MEKPPVNITNKAEISKTEQSTEHFSFSEQEKNIQEVFKLSPELKEIACVGLAIENDREIVIELGRNKENILGKIQNINVYYKGEKIIDSDGQDSSKLYLVTKEDGTSYVGDIFLPTELQRQGLAKKILQQVSDNLDTKIVPTYLSTGGFTSDNAKKMWEKIGNEILPNHEAEKLYAEYLKTVFPESKYKEIGFKGVSQDFSEENKPSFYTKDLEAAKYYAGLKEGTQTISAIFDFKNPLIVNAEKPAPIPIVTPDGKTLGTFNDKDINEKIISAGYDGLILNRNFSTPLEGWEILSFDNKSRHILGSESDIEKFKEFVFKNENKKENQSIEEFLKESGLEKVPHIETNFLFHRHATKEDGENVASKLNNTDILIHENAGWDKKRLETWRKVASGEFTAEQALEHEKERGKEFWWNDYYKAIFEKLHGSNKDVLLVDVESDDEVFQEIYSILEGNSIYNNLVNRESSYQETLEQISNYSELESLLQKERENKILENMKTNLLQLLKEKPELQNKENLNILFPMGAFHTRLYHETKKRGDKVSQEFSASPYTFDSRSTIERKIHFLGIEKAQEDMPKVLLYWLLRKSGALSTNEVPHKFVSKFSDEQIKELFNLYQKSKSDQEFKPEALNWITKYFRK